MERIDPFSPKAYFYHALGMKPPQPQPVQPPQPVVPPVQQPPQPVLPEKKPDWGNG